MILEYMPSGDLEDFIDYFKRNEQQKFGQWMILRLIPEKVILQILRDCMYGLQCLHSQSVVHRDIKPQNLFLRDGRVKIGDLGVAATFTASTGQQTCTGTVQYMAPEMIKGEPYAFSADIWSLGCVAYEMMWRKPLFNKGSYSELVTQIIEQRNPVVVSFPGIYSQKLCDVVLSMLNVSKDARPCDEEILTVIQVFVLNQRNYQGNYDLLRGYEERLFFENAFKSVVIPSIPHQNPHSGIPIECQVDFFADTTNIYQSLLKRFQSDAEFIIRNNKGLLAIYRSLYSK